MGESGAEFTGGEIEFRHRGHAPVSYVLGQGDALVWRGWDQHRVLPIRNGVRKVLVAEWWSGDNVTQDKQRDEDTEGGYKAALKIDPASPVLHFEFAEFLAKYNDRKNEAESAYRAAISIDPVDADHHGGLAVLLARHGEVEPANASFDSASLLAPDDINLRVNAAIYAEQIGQPELAKQR